MKLTYSMNDVYPFTSMSSTTSGLTVEDDYQEMTNDVVEEDGRKTFINKNMILGALLFIVVMNILIGWVD